MEIWRNWNSKLQKLIDAYAHQKQTDRSIHLLHKQWQLFQDKLPTSRVPLAHVESMLLQARKTISLVSDLRFPYVDDQNALAFFNDELHDLNLCTVDNPFKQRKDFSCLWLEKHWILCAMLEKNNQATQNPVSAEHFNDPPLPYPNIPHDVKHVHGLLEINQSGIITGRKTAIEKALAILKPPSIKT